MRLLSPDIVSGPLPNEIPIKAPETDPITTSVSDPHPICTEWDNISGPRKFMYHTYTIWLFIKADIPTVFLPMSVFAWASSNNFSFSFYTQALIWTFLQLIHFATSNQSVSPLEDLQNKPWRPIPAGRISVSATRALRWALVPVCLAASAWWGVLAAGAALVFGTWANNELALDKTWMTRSVTVALLYGAFDVGATFIALGGAGLDNARISWAPYINSLVILTTIQAADFRDEVGDRIAQRTTLPIVLPFLSRLSMPLFLCAWSLFLGIVVAQSLPLAGLLCVLGAYVGGRFWVLRDAKSDAKSYVWYHIWLALARIMPVLV